MINLNESTFFFIVILTGIFTYVFFVNYQSCDVKCNIKYYKYENHFKNDIQNKVETKDYNEDFFLDNKNINYTDDELYLNNLLKPNIYV